MSGSTHGDSAPLFPHVGTGHKIKINFRESKGFLEKMACLPQKTLVYLAMGENLLKEGGEGYGNIEKGLMLW